MAIKIAIAITLLLVGPVMSWIGDVPGVSSLPLTATKNLRMLFAAGPASGDARTPGGARRRRR
jgi:Na+/melibiose symporter-like transporter